jgi:hypothetical protein
MAADVDWDMQIVPPDESEGIEQSETELSQEKGLRNGLGGFRMRVSS